MHIHTPIITSNDCEGAGELFQVEVSCAPHLGDILVSDTLCLRVCFKFRKSCVDRP